MIGNKDFTATKRVRAPDTTTSIPSSLIVNFIDGDGNRAGSPVGKYNSYFHLSTYHHHHHRCNVCIYNNYRAHICFPLPKFGASMPVINLATLQIYRYLLLSSNSNFF